MDALPKDLLLEICDRLDHPLHLLQLRKEWHPLRVHWMQRLDTSKVRQQDRAHFVRFLELVGPYVQELIIRPNKEDGLEDTSLFVDLLEEHNPTCTRLLHRVPIIRSDATLFRRWKPFLSPSHSQCQHLILRVRRREQHDICLEGVHVPHVTLENKQRFPFESPLDVVHFQPEARQVTALQAYGLEPSVRRFDVSGAIALVDLHTTRLEKVTLDGCTVQSRFPNTIQDLEMIHVRMLYQEPLTACHNLQRLHLENMFSFSRYIPPQLWHAWRHSLVYYADLMSATSRLEHTRRLQAVQEFYVSSLGMMPNMGTFASYGIPQSHALQQLTLEGVFINEEDVPLINQCSQVQLENCYFRNQTSLLPHVHVV